MTTKILEVLQSDVDVTLNVKSNDLKEFGRYLIETASQETRDRIKAGEEDVLLSVEDVMKRLGVKDRTTLWRWKNRGYLIPVKAGKKCLYYQSEVDRLLESKSQGV